MEYLQRKLHYYNVCLFKYYVITVIILEHYVY